MGRKWREPEAEAHGIEPGMTVLVRYQGPDMRYPAHYEHAVLKTLGGHVPVIQVTSLTGQGKPQWVDVSRVTVIPDDPQDEFTTA